MSRELLAVCECSLRAKHVVGESLLVPERCVIRLHERSQNE